MEGEVCFYAWWPFLVVNIVLKGFDAGLAGWLVMVEGRVVH